MGRKSCFHSKNTIFHELTSLEQIGMLFGSEAAWEVFMSRFFENLAIIWLFLMKFTVSTAFLALCEPAVASEKGEGVIRGIAMDENGVRLPHALIWLKGVDQDPPLFRANTPKKGDEPLRPELDFDWTELKAGTYELSGVGDQVKPLTVELKEGRMIRDDIRAPVCREMDLIQRIWFAIRDDQADLVRELLAAGVDPHYTNQRHSLLTWASSRAGLDVVRLLVEAGAEVNPTPDPDERDEMRKPDPLYSLSTGMPVQL